MLAYWDPDQWGKFFGYFTQAIGNIVTTCVMPVLLWYAGTLKGKSDAHGAQIDALNADLVTVAQNVPPPVAPPPGSTTTTTTTATTKPIVNQASIDTLPLGTPSPKPTIPQPKAPTP